MERMKALTVLLSLDAGSGRITGLPTTMAATDADGDLISYTWDFGQNVATKNGRIVTVAFPTPGAITVKLFVTDDRGGTASKSQTMSINGPAPPVAAFFATPTSVQGGDTVVFDASTTTVGAGASIVDYTWNFGDGTPAGSGQVVSHSYAVVAVSTSRTVTLTVTDDLGRKSQRSTAVTVTP